MTFLWERIAVFETGPGGAEGLRINAFDDGLRIAFEVEKTIQSDTNKAAIQVYNLSRDSRGRMKKGNVARLWTGYKTTGTLDMIYEGEISRVEPGARSGPDIITTIECGDGNEVFQAQDISRTFPVGTAVTDVILAVAKQFTLEFDDPSANEVIRFGQAAKPKTKKTSRISVKNLARKGGDLTTLDRGLSEQGFATVLRRPMSVAGNAREVMDRLARMWRFDWSIQDGEFQVLGYGQGAQGDAIVLGPTTGLIGVPEPTDFGCRFTSLIMPRLRPGSIVQIESETLKGMFRAEGVRLSGDTRSESWTADVEAARI